VGELQSKLETLGYQVGFVARLIGNFWLVFFIGAGVLIAILITVMRFLGIF
jgi:hypothetical protein